MFTIHRLFMCPSQTVLLLPFFPPRKTKHWCYSLHASPGCVSDAVQVVLVVLEQQPVRDLVKSQGCGKEQLVSWTKAAPPMPEKSSRGSHYTAAVPGRRMGHWGPLAMLQSLMPSICLNGFLNPGPPFDSSPRQAVLHLLSLSVINPFISKRSDQCCLEWGLPCWGNAAGKSRASAYPQCPWGWKWN